MIAFIERLSTSRVYRCYFIYKANMDNYKVYKHTFPNGKVYIGITQQTLKRRWQKGLGYKKQLFVFNAIKKYGWENVKHEIIFENLSKKDAEQKEKELISLYKSNNRQYGYNIENGGNVNKVSAETKEKLRKAHTGKTLSEEHKKKLSIAHKGKRLSTEHIQKIASANKGKKHTEKTKKYLSMINTGKRSKLKGRKRPQYIIDKIREKNLGKKRTEEQKERIRIRLIGRKMSESNKTKILNAKRKPVEKYSKDNILLQTYIDIKSAGTENNIHTGSISEVCQGKRKTAGGYIWKYKLKEIKK